MLPLNSKEEKVSDKMFEVVVSNVGSEEEFDAVFLGLSSAGRNDVNASWNGEDKEVFAVVIFGVGGNDESSN